MPTVIKITGRTSSITNAFGNGIIPSVQPTQEQIKKALNILGMTEETICCSYCGNPCTEWDHFHPLIIDKKPTGYISEINNLVPACSKCNQSKGNKNWRVWIESDAKQSPKTRKIPDLQERIKKLENYEEQCKCTKLKFEEIPEIKDEWVKYWSNHDELLEQMRKYQVLADKIQKDILKYYNSLPKD